MTKEAKRLQIVRGLCGVQNTWRDVTAFLQGRIKRDRLSLRFGQPFREIGGDPAFGRRKKLIIRYRYDGKPRLLMQTEQYPLAFAIDLPPVKAASSKAVTARLRGKSMRKCTRNRPSMLTLEFEDGTRLRVGADSGRLKATITDRS